MAERNMAISETKYLDIAASNISVGPINKDGTLYATKQNKFS